MNCEKTGVVCDGFPEIVHWEYRIALQRAATDLKAKSKATTSSTIVDTPVAFYSSFSTGFQSNNLYDIVQPYDPVQNQAHAMDQNILHLDSDPSMELVLKSESQQAEMPEPFDDLVLTGEEDGVLDDAHPYYSHREHIHEPRSIPFLIPGINCEMHYNLFFHFMQITSRVLTVPNGESNPMNAIILPMASRDKTVMNAILSLAGSHFLRLHPDESNLELMAERDKLHQAACLQQFYRLQDLRSKARIKGSIIPVSDSPPNAEVLFATSLLLLLFEICEGTSDTTLCDHLNAAGQVIDIARKTDNIPVLENSSQSNSYLGPEQLPTNINPFLMEYYLYHTSLAAVTNGSSLNTIELQNLIARANHNPTMIGVLDGLLKFNFRIRALHKESHQVPSHRNGNIIAEAVIIWEDLESFHCNANVSIGDEIITRCYKEAFYIWLSLIVCPEQKEDTKVQTIVQKMSTDMFRIEFGDGVMSCLLFPLFIIGIASVRREDRNAVSTHFERLQKWSAMGNVDATLRLVQMLWDDHDDGLPGSWDWIKKMESEGMSLMVT